MDNNGSLKGYILFNFNFFMMRNLILTLLSLLTVGAYAQQESVKDTVLTQQLEEVVVSSRVIDVAKERVTPVAISTISASDIA